MTDEAAGADARAAVDRISSGDRRALARAITEVENRTERGAALTRAAFAGAVAAPVIGMTGAGGAGKSTLVDELTTAYRRARQSVAVLAIDPTSPFSGGALLGDRVRMQRHSEDADVYVRSMATRGAMGGLAAAVYDTLVLLAAAGFDRVIIETVGVGQDEVDVAAVADTTCLLLTPAAGDEVQAIKAGVMEVADILVLNKADLPGADRAEAWLHGWVTGAAEDDWGPPIVRTVASRGEGVAELMEVIDRHRDWCRDSDAATDKKRALARLRLRALLRDRLERTARERGFDAERERQMVEAIADGTLDPHSAAEQVVEEVMRP